MSHSESAGAAPLPLVTPGAIRRDAMATVENCPPDATIEDILYDLDFREMIAVRMAEIDRGEAETIPHEEAVKRMTRWRASSGT